MTIRELVIREFPPTKSTHSIHQLAQVLWNRRSADIFRNVSDWRDLLEFESPEQHGDVGIGVLLTFMEADSQAAYLPAWLVLGYELPPTSRINPHLVGVLDSEYDMDEIKTPKFDYLTSVFSAPQCEGISEVLLEISSLYSKIPNLLQDSHRIIRVSHYWKDLAQTKRLA